MEKMVMYQLLVRLFGNTRGANVKDGTIEQNGCGKFNDISDKALKSIRDLGATHVWYTGVIEQAKVTDYQKYGIAPYPPHLVKGKAGSPYAIVDYYDVDPDLASNVEQRMSEFDALVERTHNNGLGAIIDFVPNHVARIYKSDVKPIGIEDFGEHDDTSQPFAPNNNYYYLSNTAFQAPVSPGPNPMHFDEAPAKVTGNDCFTASPSVFDWYETVKLNYGVDLFHGRLPHFFPIPDTWQKMLHILLFWANKGVDGFRCDMAEMIPVSFWNYAIGAVKEKFPNVMFIAEVYNPSLYYDYVNQGRFDLLYDKVGMYDTLRSVVKGDRAAADVSAAWEAIAPLRKHMLFFLENHDEQRIASSFFAGDGQKGWPGFFVAATLHSNPLLIYFGQEVGVDGMDEEGFSGIDGRTSIFDYWGIKQFQHWVNKGKFDGSNLPSDKLLLRDKYMTLLNLIRHEAALNSGELYDLLNSNVDNPLYNTVHTMAYLRYTLDSVLLCVVNFSDSATTARLIIPEHALDLCQLDPNAYFKATDLISGKAKIHFPGQVAYVGGIGVKLEPRQTLVFRLK